MSSVTKKGLTTIYWGTDGLLTGVSTAIVNSAKYTTVGGKIGMVEDGNGAEVASVLLDDGFDAELECVYDSALSIPDMGDTVTLKRPSDATAVNCLCVANPGYDASKKNAATFTLKLEYRPNRTLS